MEAGTGTLSGDLFGAGGMGEVYLAEDTRLGRRVALKFLSTALTRQEDRLRRFEWGEHAWHLGVLFQAGDRRHPEDPVLLSS